KLLPGGEQDLHDVAHELGLGIASTLKPGERDAMGPSLNTGGLFAEILGYDVEDHARFWPLAVRRFLGLRLCPEEAGSNWARRPLRRSQLHHATAEAWTQIPVLRAICAYGVAPPSLLRRHLRVKTTARVFTRIKASGKYVVGQLAPPGRLAASGDAPQASDEVQGEAAGPTSRVASIPSLVSGTRIALLRPAPGTSTPPLKVEVLEERFGGQATVVPLSARETTEEALRVPAARLQPCNSWEDARWIAALPRPGTGGFDASGESAC
ncbi:unnamed protein product, partial [Polarella glacialis]